MNLSLDNRSILQGESCIKNAHTASHLRILNNELVFLCIEEAIHIYSLPKIAEYRAALIKVISLSSIFSEFKREYYQDYITGIFHNAEKQDFSARLFSREKDIKKNALLQVENIRERINFFNKAKLRVRRMQFSAKGQLLLILYDGRGAVLFPKKYDWVEGDYQTIDLNEISKEKVLEGCFVQQWISLLMVGRIAIYETVNRTRILNQKITYNQISSIYGIKLENDSVRMFLVCNHRVAILDINNRKKKMNAYQFRSQEFINQSFFYLTHLFICTYSSVLRLELKAQQIQSNSVAVFSSACELLYLDQSGKFYTKPLTNNRECVWLAESTTNGVFIGVTIRRNGNYKEGRLIVFQPQISYYLQRLILNVKFQRQINMGDSIFVTHRVENKQALYQFGNLHRESRLSYSGLTITQKEYDTVNINIGHAFEGKQIVKQRIIQRVLRQKFQSLRLQHNKMDYTELISRCCFTGVKILDEDLKHCAPCDLYGISTAGGRCPVCQRKMLQYQQIM